MFLRCSRRPENRFSTVLSYRLDDVVKLCARTAPGRLSDDDVELVAVGLERVAQIAHDTQRLFVKLPGGGGLGQFLVGAVGVAADSDQRSDPASPARAVPSRAQPAACPSSCSR